MKPYRSMLFVPGHKSSWAEKGVAAGADALILDLEDAVPAAQKAEARNLVRETIGRLGGEDTRADLWVRPNSFDSALFGADVESVVTAGLAGLVLPKVFSAEEVVRIDAIVSHIEEREGLAPGSVGLIITYETAESMARCEEIAAASPRIASLLGGTGPNADVGRSLGFEFTVEGLESLYVRSRIILAARASGLHHPLTGVWQDLTDLAGFRRFAEDSRRLGFRGMMCIHPSHVGPSNEIFTPSPETVAFYRRMVEAFHKAAAEGHGAVDFEGMHIDLAHARTAEGVLELADAIGV
ncbi:CoA ester lyase [Amycolatopsis acidicola]|uniref:CoA ester lyase n=1 Tax=Amycolatopsis acidicola TaxID=2596893 RepID=A0A5N0VA10_9PSEU|nr:CoA ester lyase [Amycolatopsis acidicola]KAA9163229.1 CoA ester lyase [Amycolatopsis acidicola]